MRAWFYACVCARAHVCFARVCARASVLMPGRLASCSVWQIYSADIAELCAALENLLSAINVGSHEKLKTWELVVWRDVLAAFGLVPKPGACASKPTSPRVFTRRALQHERVSGGPYDGALAFEMWDLWWWHGAEFWPEAVRRYRKAAGIILPGFLEQMGVVAPRQPAPRAARVPPAVRRAGPLARASRGAVKHVLPDLFTDPPAWLSQAADRVPIMRSLGRRYLVRSVLLNLKLTAHHNKRENRTSYSYYVTRAGGAIYKRCKAAQARACYAPYACPPAVCAPGQLCANPPPLSPHPHSHTPLCLVQRSPLRRSSGVERPPAGPPSVKETP